MTLKNAFNFFESLVSETSKKSEIKVYQEFIQIITGLENKNLSESEIQSIEIELDALDLNSTTKNNKKYFKKSLGKFKMYLKNEFSLISKGYYTELGMALGMCLGVASGSLIDERLGVSSGLAIGMFIGLIVGRYMDGQAKTQGKVI